MCRPIRCLRFGFSLRALSKLSVRKQKWELIHSFSLLCLCVEIIHGCSFRQSSSTAAPVSSQTWDSTHHHHRPYWLSLIFLIFNYQSPTSCMMFVQSPGKSCITTYISQHLPLAVQSLYSHSHRLNTFSSLHATTSPTRLAVRQERSGQRSVESLSVTLQHTSVTLRYRAGTTHSHQTSYTAQKRWKKSSHW